VSQQPLEREHRITPLELFFDLVFVFAFTQVTTVFLHDQTWTGLADGLLILAVLWWAWASYAWLTNTVDAGRDPVLGAVLVAMAAMFVAALAVPQAFGSHGVLFGVAFLIVAFMHLSLTALSARTEPDRLAAIQRILPSSLAGAALILAAGFFDGALRSVLWLVALVVGFLAPLVIPVHGWRLAPAHFVERHGLIVIIAIGESLIAIGLGARTTQLGAGVVVAAVLGFVVAASFWLAYFDYFPTRMEQLLTERQGSARVTLARDVYSYLHLPMIAGIALFAFAVEVTLAHLGDELASVPACALCIGPALYLAAFVALRVRVARTVGRGRLAATVACVALFPVALVVPALVALALVAAVWVVLHAYEIVWWREARAEARALRLST
jgi:low temperature requirement protein LtrA